MGEMKSSEQCPLFGLKQGGTTERVEPSSLIREGPKAFVFQAPEKAFLRRSRSAEPLNVPNAYAWGFSLPAVLPGSRCVSTHQGRAGAKAGLFEQLAIGGELWRA